MSDADLRALLRESYEELKRTRARLAALEGQLHEPIAVASMACRLPGGADTPEALFRLFLEGRSAVGEPPPSRGAGPKGSYLTDIDQFDPAFFDLSFEEARQADPQQRLLLEVAWEALERAGITREAVKGRRVGVFVGASAGEYGERMRGAPPEQRGVLGSVLSALSGRVSYFLGITGPSVTIDAGCASSLVAVHFAVQALRRRECDLALAGGVNVILDPSGALVLDKLGVLSKSGSCRPFDASADGFVRGEGCGLVLLERAGDAQRHGGPVLALIRGSAVNHVGASNGMATPNGPAQEAVVRQALEDGKVDPGEISYVECHGTGTRSGDAIEVQALASVYAPARRAGRPLLVGSAKRALGHGESVAGVTSLIKAVTCLQRREIPGCSVEAPSDIVPWGELAVSPVAENQRWEAAGAQRRAGVHAYSMTGANAHLVIEAAPAPPAPARRAPRPGALPLLLSAHSEAALVAQARRLLGHLQATPGLALEDLATSLATARTHFDHRLAIRASDTASILEALRRFADTGEAPGHRGVVEPLPGVAFVFPGGMAAGARELAEAHPAFQDIFDGVVQRLAPRRNDDAEALFAVEVALAKLLQRWGVSPDLVLGEGIGTLAAACVAEACSAEQASSLVAAMRSEGVHDLQRALRQTTFRAPAVPLSCAVTGQSIEARDLSSIDFWLDRIERAGRGPRGLSQPGITTFVPLDAVRDRAALLDALMSLHVHGVAVRWEEVLAPFGGRRVDLPTYAWQRRRCWVDEPSR